MGMRIIILVIILLVSIGVVSAIEMDNFESYTYTVELSEENSFHEIIGILNLVKESQELNFTLPPRVENLKFFIDEQEKSCVLEEKEGFSILYCSFSKPIIGKHIIKMYYNTAYPIFKIRNRVLYKSEYFPLYKTSKLNYILKLPVGYVIPKDKDVSFFVNPKAKSVYSDGQRIILLWEKRDVISSFELSVLIEPVIEPSRWVLWVGLMLVLLMILAVFLFLKKIKKKEIKYPALIEHERVIVDILKKAKADFLWQKQLQIKTGFSKVKLSRVLHSLEQREVIKKERWGNTNKIYLVKEEE